MRRCMLGKAKATAYPTIASAWGIRFASITDTSVNVTFVAVPPSTTGNFVFYTALASPNWNAVISALTEPGDYADADGNYNSAPVILSDYYLLNKLVGTSRGTDVINLPSRQNAQFFIIAYRTVNGITTFCPVTQGVTDNPRNLTY